MREENRDSSSSEKPTLAYVAGGIGLILTLSLLGFIGWEAVIRSEGPAPSVTVEAKQVRPTAGGYLVEIEVRNTTAATAADVQVEAELAVPGSKAVVSSVTFDYVPGNSIRKGGIYLPADPATGSLKVRALGYTKP